jgi:hypothetical protein
MLPKTVLAQPLKFIARASTMGNKKLVIYVPIEFREEILKRWGKHQIKVTLEDAV